MSKAKFKVGDTVRILDGSKIDGYTGGFNEVMKRMCGEIRTIKEVTARNNGEKPCYYLENTRFLWDERGLERVGEGRKIVITVTGRTTRAAMYDGHKLIKESTAKCHKDDVFYFETGAALAFDRLVGACKETKTESKLEPLNTKIFVLDGANSSLETAHIYEIVDGKIKIPTISGWRSAPVCGTLYNMEDVVNYLTPRKMRENDKDSAGFILSEFCTRKVTVMEVKEG